MHLYDVNAKVGYLIIPGQIRSAPNGRFNIKSQTYMVEMAKTTRTGRKEVLVDIYIEITTVHLLPMLT